MMICVYVICYKEDAYHESGTVDVDRMADVFFEGAFSSAGSPTNTLDP